MRSLACFAHMHRTQPYFAFKLVLPSFVPLRKQSEFFLQSQQKNSNVFLCCLWAIGGPSSFLSGFSAWPLGHAPKTSFLRVFFLLVAHFPAMWRNRVFSPRITENMYKKKPKGDLFKSSNRFFYVALVPGACPKTWWKKQASHSCFTNLQNCCGRRLWRTPFWLLCTDIRTRRWGSGKKIYVGKLWGSSRVEKVKHLNFYPCKVSGPVLAPTTDKLFRKHPK